MEKLDPARIKELMKEADDRWYRTHLREFTYEQHLEFTANYVADNYYHKRRKK